MKTRFRYGLVWGAVLTLMVGGIACSQEAGTAGADKAKEIIAQTADVKKTDADPTSKVELRFVLAKADQVDGTEDHVVSKCPGCALAMDGKEDHALEVEDYELHFCSDRCRDGFKENTADAVMALTLPEAG